eukprot:9982041-Alexandrium_andersonii.AAC.1
MSHPCRMCGRAKVYANLSACKLPVLDSDSRFRLLFSNGYVKDFSTGEVRKAMAADRLYRRTKAPHTEPAVRIEARVELEHPDTGLCATLLQYNSAG